MKKLLVTLAIFLSVSNHAFADVSYSRNPSGSEFSGPVTWTVTVTDFSDYGAGSEPTWLYFDYYNVVTESEENYSVCYPYEDNLEVTFSMNPGVWDTVDVLATDESEEDCNLTPNDGNNVGGITLFSEVEFTVLGEEDDGYLLSGVFNAGNSAGVITGGLEDYGNTLFWILASLMGIMVGVLIIRIGYLHVRNLPGDPGYDPSRGSYRFGRGRKVKVKSGNIL